MHSRLPLSFYKQEDVVQIARDLLGKFLMTNIGDEGVTGGMIVETEAYAGALDKASHAYGNRKTPRTQIMYEEGGVAYVYFIYGFHHLFNVITNHAHIPQAVLIRAIEPIEGIDLMLKRRGMQFVERKLTAGPGVLCKALGITKEQNGLSLMEDIVWIEDRNVRVSNKNIIAGPRVNVSYAGDDALLPYRFMIKGNNWVSKRW